MSNMVTNFTSTVPSQSTSAPAKHANDEAANIQQSGNSKIAQSTPRQTPAADTPSDNANDNVEQNLNDVVDRLNDFVQQTQRDLNFKVDKESGRTVVTVIDSVTDEVIRQIPSKEALERLQHLEDIQGLLLRDQA